MKLPLKILSGDCKGFECVVMATSPLPFSLSPLPTPTAQQSLCCNSQSDVYVCERSLDRALIVCWCRMQVWHQIAILCHGWWCDEMWRDVLLWCDVRNKGNRPNACFCGHDVKETPPAFLNGCLKTNTIAGVTCCDFSETDSYDTSKRQFFFSFLFLFEVSGIKNDVFIRRCLEWVSIPDRTLLFPRKCRRENGPESWAC